MKRKLTILILAAALAGAVLSAAAADIVKVGVLHSPAASKPATNLI